MSAFKVFGITVIAVLCGATVRAMDAESIRLVTWHHGETIEGEEFIAANEAIVDYLATLQHAGDLPFGPKSDRQPEQCGRRGPDGL
jgi:hypothetical protein